MAQPDPRASDAAPLSSRLSEALSDRYGLEREPGAGGMATVYLAEDLRHHRKVAIKALRPELAAVLGAEARHPDGRLLMIRRKETARSNLRVVMREDWLPGDAR